MPKQNLLGEIEALIAPYRGTRDNGLPWFAIDPAQHPGSPIAEAHGAMVAAEAAAAEAAGAVQRLEAEEAEHRAALEALLADPDAADPQAYASHVAGRDLCAAKAQRAHQRARQAAAAAHAASDAYWQRHNHVAEQLRELDALARALAAGAPRLMEGIAAALSAPAKDRKAA